MNQEFLRMQKLAGVKPQPAFDNLVIEALTEYYLYINYHSKGILIENLNEGVFTKLKNTLVTQFKGIKPSEALATVLFAKLRNLVKDEKVFNSIVKYIKSNKDENPSKEEIGKFLDTLTPIKEAKTPAWKRAVLIGMAALIGTLSATKYNSDKIDDIADKSKDAKVETAIQQTPGLDSDPDTVDYEEGVKQLAKDLKTPDNVQKALDKTSGSDGNKVTTSDDGKEINISNDEGEYKITDEDKTAEQIADELAALIPDGEIADEATLDLEGKISDTPGSDSNDNLANDGNKDLAGKRLESAKSLLIKVKDILKTKYKDKFPDPDNQVKVGKETKVKGTKKVGAEGDPNEQTIKFKIKDIKTKKVEKDKAPLPGFDTQTYLRAPRITAPDANKYTVLAAQFLPELVNRGIYGAFRSNLELKDGEVLSDKTVNDNITRLEQLNTEEAKYAVKILKWLRYVKKNPKSLATEFKRLDPKINLTFGGTNVEKPGEKGKSIERPGSGLTQTPQSDQRVAENHVSLMEIYSSLLLEAESDFQQLPGYFGDDDVRAKLGVLVPLYMYNWNVGGDIEYIANQYKYSFNNFSKNYPVVLQKLQTTKGGTQSSTDDKNTQAAGTDQSSKKDQTTATQGGSLDKKQDQIKTKPDIVRIDQIVSNNKPLMNVLKRINTQDELASLLTAIFIFRDKKGQSLFPQGKQFKDDPGKVRSALFGLNYRLKEADAKEIPFDVKDFMTRLEATPGLVLAINKVNDLEEFYEMLLRVILPKINPTLLKNTSTLKSAIAKAANASRQFADKGKYNV